MNLVAEEDIWDSTKARGGQKYFEINCGGNYASTSLV